MIPILCWDITEHSRFHILWDLFVGLPTIRAPYYLGSTTGPLIFGNSHMVYGPHNALEFVPNQELKRLCMEIRSQELGSWNEVTLGP